MFEHSCEASGVSVLEAETDGRTAAAACWLGFEGGTMASASASASDAKRKAPPQSDEEWKYEQFKAKVKRTVYLENLSPLVTEAVIKNAFSQLGQVESVELLPDLVTLFNGLPQAALVEMESEKQAKAVVTTLSDFPFMIGGMPRPVRARAAWLKLFPDRPAMPGKKPVEFRWVGPLDPQSDHVKKLELIIKRHQAERMALIKAQLEVEEKLAEQQQEVLTTNYKKYEIIEKSVLDRTIPNLASRYDINIADEM